MATRRLLVTDIHDTRLMYIAELVNPRDAQLKVLNGAKGSSRDIAPLNSTGQRRFTTSEMAADWHWL